MIRIVFIFSILTTFTINLNSQSRGLGKSIPNINEAGSNYIFTIGIDEYSDPSWHTLQKAKYDALDIVNIFGDYLDFQNIVDPLLNENATKATIYNVIRDSIPIHIKPADNLIIFFAGHGHKQKRETLGAEFERGYLVTHESSGLENSDMKTYISLQNFLDEISQINAKHILVILDACHSGFALADIPNVTFIDGSGFTIDSPSRMVITSAGANELASEEQIRHGSRNSLFTTYLLDELKQGNLSEFNSESLFGRIKEKVVRASKELQNPQISSFSDFHREGVMSFILDTSKIDILNETTFDYLVGNTTRTSIDTVDAKVTIALMEFENFGDERYDHYARKFETEISRGIKEIKKFDDRFDFKYSSSITNYGRGISSNMYPILKRIGADYLVEGSYYNDDDYIYVDLVLRSVETGEPLGIRFPQIVESNKNPRGISIKLRERIKGFLVKDTKLWDTDYPVQDHRVSQIIHEVLSTGMYADDVKRAREKLEFALSLDSMDLTANLLYLKTYTYNSVDAIKANAYSNTVQNRFRNFDFSDKEKDYFDVTCMQANFDRRRYLILLNQIMAKYPDVAYYKAETLKNYYLSFQFDKYVSLFPEYISLKEQKDSLYYSPYYYKLYAASLIYSEQHSKFDSFYTNIIERDPSIIEYKFIKESFTCNMAKVKTLFTDHDKHTLSSLDSTARLKKIDFFTKRIIGNSLHCSDNISNVDLSIYLNEALVANQKIDLTRLSTIRYLNFTEDHKTALSSINQRINQMDPNSSGRTPSLIKCILAFQSLYANIKLGHIDENKISQEVETLHLKFQNVESSEIEYETAKFYSLLGNKDKAMLHLKLAFNQGKQIYPTQHLFIYEFHPLFSHPVFKNFLLNPFKV
jgi:TolB-like protein